MAQYGTIVISGNATTVTTNSTAIITGSGTLWSTSPLVTAGDIFTIAGINYDIASVDSETQLTLTSAYAGADGAGQTYVVSSQFTANHSISYTDKGDVETAAINKRAMKTIDTVTSNLSSDGATFSGSFSGGFSGVTIDLASNTLTGTTAEFNTALSDDDFVTIGGTETISGVKTFSNDIRMASGKGIDFSGAGTVAEILDDYEEGTWTPVISDAGTGGNTGTGTVAGTYTKTGNTTHLDFYIINLNTSGMTAGNYFFIQGIPFPVAATIEPHGSVSLGSCSFSGNINLFATSSTSFLRVVESIGGGGAVDFLLVSDFTSGQADIRGSITYKAST